jgi:hypothetical protein
MSTAGNTTLSTTFTPSDATDYNTNSATVTLTVNPVVKTTPTITWNTPAAITYGTALSVTQLNATASVGGSYSYSPPLGTVLNAGLQTLTVNFTPTDTAYYNTASKSVTLTVNKATPAITWNTPAPVTVGTALSATQLNATSSVPGSFVYSPALGIVMSTAGNTTLSTTFTPSDATDYNTNSATVTLTVNPVVKTTPTITWNTPAAIAYGTALSVTQLNATASVGGSYSYSPPLGTVLNAGLQTLTVNFTPTDTADYNTASKSVTLTVNKATPTITWNTPAPVTVGTALSATQLNATTSVPGSFVYSPALGTVMSTAGNITLSTTFTPSDTTDYFTNSATVILAVTTAPVATFSIAGTAVSVRPGATTGNTSTITLTPANGFTGTITLSCAISPTAANFPATCTVPPSVTISGITAQTVTLTVSTTAAVALNKPLNLFWPSTGGAVLACILMLGIPARRRRWRSMLGMLVLLSLLTSGASACGGNSSFKGGSSGTPGTTAGLYTITVTGTSATTVQTGTVSLTVQ